MNKIQDFAWCTAGKVINGVTVSESGEVAMYTIGVLAKTGLAAFTPMKETEDSGVSKYFTVTRRILKIDDNHSIREEVE